MEYLTGENVHCSEGSLQNILATVEKIRKGGKDGLLVSWGVALV